MQDVTEVTSTLEEAKAEMAAVLSSSTFVRTPRLARLLKYLCTTYFAGKADQIKEYNIAVDLLGRPESFDPGADAIARVEVHRLRKKLKEYYETEGSSRSIHIVIPTGCYVPSFARLEPVTEQPSPEPADRGSGRERQLIETALAQSRGRVYGPHGAAAKLRIPPSTLDSKIRKLQIRKSHFKLT